ncbi:MAG: adenosylmethionine--8-amino-7-oxononanoate transaminase [Candidatus Omnitrophota bacterium]|nr:adenosylmethionine--8-amino-7-oxononanoate transaminase [Candidatus Omnitrophota bacterium]
MNQSEWIKKDLEYNWHPYTQMKDCVNFPPILIEKARGAKLYDANGKFYYDTISSWWSNVHGHNHPRIMSAIKKQASLLDHVLFAGFTHKSAILLAEKLVSLAPEGLRKAFFSDNGSTAVETALKMSFQYWRNTGNRRKTKFICLDYGYHGDTVGAMSVSGVGLFNKVFSPLLFSAFKAPSPYCYRCPLGKTRDSCGIDCVGLLENILREKSDNIAALILEPIVMAAGGMIIYPPEYLRRAAELSRKYGIHLIVDEVATAFGRTGKMFASEHASIAPDFMCLSKGLTSGSLPLGATLVSDKIYKAFYGDYREKKAFYHGHTFTANPISCSAALESLKVFEDEDTLGKANKISALFHAGLERFRALEIVGDVRRIGLIGALEIVRDRARKKPFGFEERIGQKIYKEGLKANLILRPLGSIIYLILPLCVKKNEIEYIIDKTYSVIASIKPKVTGGVRPLCD